MEGNLAIGDPVQTRYGYGIVSGVADEAVKVELDARMWSWFLREEVLALAVSPGTFLSTSLCGGKAIGK